MAISYSPCNLCEDSLNKRVPSSLSNLYVTLMKLPQENRRKEISSLLKTKPCAVAKMAVVYRNELLAEEFVKKFGKSTKMLPHCPNRCTATCVAVSLADLAGNLERLFISNKENRIENKEMPYIENVSRVPESSYGFDLDTNQGTLGLTYLSDDVKEQPDLRIFSGYTS